MGVVVTSGPPEEPISIAEAKAYARVDIDDDDELIAAMIVAARQWSESFANRIWIETAFQWTLDGFFNQFCLPRCPVISVDQFDYVDQQGVTQTLAPSGYQVDTTDPLEARIRPAYNQHWPVARAVYSAVTIDFTAGFGPDADSVPELVKQAIKVVVNDFYEHRESFIAGTSIAKVPRAAEALLGLKRKVSV